MSKFSKILCVIDPTSDSQPALARAAWLAKQSGATLDLLICYYNEALSGGRLFDSRSLKKARKEVLERHKSTLEAMAEPLRAEGLTVSTYSTWDHPLHEGIVRQATVLESDIVFKDTHHHAVLSRSLFTNSDWNLIRTCPAPLWLVKPNSIDDRTTFLAAIDPMNDHDKPAALDDRIITLAKSFADDVGGEVHVFHAYDPRLALSGATAHAYAPVSLPVQELEEQVRVQHRDRFEEVIKSHSFPDDHAHLICGLTHEKLPSVADELSADVVVMGAVSRNRLKRLFIGSTAERTLEHIPCDLLVVKPDWFRTPVDLEASDATQH